MHLGGSYEPPEEAGHGQGRRCKPLSILELLVYFLHSNARCA